MSPRSSARAWIVRVHRRRIDPNRSARGRHTRADHARCAPGPARARPIAHLFASWPARASVRVLTPLFDCVFGSDEAETDEPLGSADRAQAGHRRAARRAHRVRSSSAGRESARVSRSAREQTRAYARDVAHALVLCTSVRALCTRVPRPDTEVLRLVSCTPVRALCVVRGPRVPPPLRPLACLIEQCRFRLRLPLHVHAHVCYSRVTL